MDTDDLLKSMVDYMYLISDTAYNLAWEKWKNVFEMLEIPDEKHLIKRRKLSVDSEENLSDDDEENLSDDDEDSHDKHMMLGRKIIAKKFNTYCHQIPVLGFHSSKYDLPLIREKLAKIFNLTEDAYVIKRNNAYISISQKKLKMLDITNFLAAGSSYSQFLKAYKVEE